MAHYNILLLTTDPEDDFNIDYGDEWEKAASATGADYIGDEENDGIEEVINGIFGGAARLVRLVRMEESEDEDDWHPIGWLEFDESKLKQMVKDSIDLAIAGLKNAKMTAKDEDWVSLRGFSRTVAKQTKSTTYGTDIVHFDYEYMSPMTFVLDYLAYNKGKKIYVARNIDYHY